MCSVCKIGLLLTEDLLLHESNPAWPSCLLLPVLLNVETPFPLQVDVLIVVSEEAVYGVRSSGHHAGRSVFGWCGVGLDLRFRRVGADHVGHFVHCREDVKNNEMLGYERLDNL